MDLSVVLPAYNEAQRLPQTLRSIISYAATSPHSLEVIVVDDGSTDATADVAQSIGYVLPSFRVLRLSPNGGKGHAVRAGMLAALGEAVLFMDADNSTDLAEVEKLLPFLKKAEVVIGSRHLDAASVIIRQPWYRIVLSRLANSVIQLVAVHGIRDTQCGFKVFRRAAAQEIFSRQRIMGFGFDIEILSIAQRVLGYRIIEVPVSWYDTPGSKVRPLRDAGRTLRELCRILFLLLRGAYR